MGNLPAWLVTTRARGGLTLGPEPHRLACVVVIDVVVLRPTQRALVSRCWLAIATRFHASEGTESREGVVLTGIPVAKNALEPIQLRRLAFWDRLRWNGDEDDPFNVLLRRFCFHGVVSAKTGVLCPATD